MLLDFSVTNFRSIREEQTLSMLATSLKDYPENLFTSINENDKKIKILKIAGIYGANASGKSNILNALKTNVEFITNSLDIKVAEKIKYYDPFQLDISYRDKPTKMEIEFINDDNIRYLYGYSYNEIKVLNEYLFYYPKGRKKILFERRENEAINYGDDLEGDKKIIERQLLPNNLYLTKAANSNNKQLNNIYSFFLNRLLFGTSFVEIIEKLDNIPNLTLKSIPDDFFDAFLKIADLGIDSIKHQFDLKFYENLKRRNPNMNDEDLKENSFIPQISHNVYMNDVVMEKTTFEIDRESKGTKRLYVLLPLIYTALRYNVTLIIDEFENGLHPYMTNLLLSIFRSNKSQNQSCQLIFTTHDISFLGLNILRRDQIWFTEKDNFGVTHLYSLSEFKNNEIRKNTPLDKWYLSGRFGGLPLIGDLNNLIAHAKEKKQ